MPKKPKPTIPVPAAPNGLNEFSVDQVIPNVHTEQFLRQRIRQVMAQNSELHAQLGAREEFAREITAALVAPPEFPKFRYTPSHGKSEAIAVLELGDWHIGEMTRPAETEGWGSYSWAVAQSRMFHIVNEFLKWAELQRAAYRIESACIIGLGDWISGDIHDELRTTNEFPIPEQTANAGFLLGEVIRILTGHFRTVQVELAGADNHGRLTRKPQAKAKARNSMTWLVNKLAEAYTRSCRNMRLHASIGIKHVATIGRFRFLIEHGDGVRGWMGIPFYGFERMLGREALRRMNTDKGFHFWSLGHWHVPTKVLGRVLVNGSLSGTNEYDHSFGRISEPCQVGYLVGQHGIFNWTEFGEGNKLGVIPG